MGVHIVALFTRRQFAAGLIAVSSLDLAANTASAALSPSQLAATPITRLDLPWWRRRFEEKQRRLRQGAKLVWLGDSITQNWERNGPEAWGTYAPIWEQFYGKRDAVNLGFVGDTTANLLWRVENMDIEAAKPSVAIMLIGANNFGRVHWPAEATVHGISANLDALTRLVPRIRVLLLGVLPSERGPWVDEQTRQTNRMLGARFVQATDRIVFLDVDELFFRDGSLDRSMFYDPFLQPPEPPLHPTASAMRRLAEAIEPTVSRLLM
jgi:lysophospholipase L1-like esterase